MKKSRMASMLRRLPCKTEDMPQNLRMFHVAESDGLAEYNPRTGEWSVTDSGHQFVEADEKARKDRRRIAARARREVYRSLGMKRNLDGSWE